MGFLPSMAGRNKPIVGQKGTKYSPLRGVDYPRPKKKLEECPNCKTSIREDNQKYCENCGVELK